MKHLLLFLTLSLVYTSSAQADEPWICGDPQKDMYYVLLERPKKTGSPWPVKMMNYDTLKKTYREEKDLTCQTNLDPKKPDVLTDCQVLYGPDGGMNLSVAWKDNKRYAFITPFGPTGSGETINLRCVETAN